SLQYGTPRFAVRLTCRRLQTLVHIGNGQAKNFRDPVSCAFAESSGRLLGSSAADPQSISFRIVGSDSSKPGYRGVGSIASGHYWLRAPSSSGRLFAAWRNLLCRSVHSKGQAAPARLLPAAL